MDITEKIIKPKLEVVHGNWKIEEFDGFVSLFHQKDQILRVDQLGFINVIELIFQYLEAQKQKLNEKPRVSRIK